MAAFSKLRLSGPEASLDNKITVYMSARSEAWSAYAKALRAGDKTMVKRLMRRRFRPTNWLPRSAQQDDRLPLKYSSFSEERAILSPILKAPEITNGSREFVMGNECLRS